MKKNSLIKGILLVIIVSTVMIITSSVYASGETIVLTQNTPANNTATDNSATNNTATNSALTSTLTPTTPANNTSTLESNLPKTGIADNTIVFALVGVCVVAAIYAYRKVRDYKGI